MGTPPLAKRHAAQILRKLRRNSSAENSPTRCVRSKQTPFGVVATQFFIAPEAILGARVGAKGSKRDAKGCPVLAGTLKKEPSPTSEKVVFV